MKGPTRVSLTWALAILIAAILLVLLCGLLLPKPPAPTPIPPTAGPTQTVAPPTLSPTATSTARPTATLKPPPSVTPIPPATATPEPYVPKPTPPPLPTTALRGVHRVQPGDTLWDIACLWYDDMPLRPGANPLTPCTCWPGIYWTGPQVWPPQLIYPGEQYGIPLVCGQ